MSWGTPRRMQRQVCNCFMEENMVALYILQVYRVYMYMRVQFTRSRKVVRVNNGQEQCAGAFEPSRLRLKERGFFDVATVYIPADDRPLFSSFSFHPFSCFFSFFCALTPLVFIFSLHTLFSQHPIEFYFTFVWLSRLSRYVHTFFTRFWLARPGESKPKVLPVSEDFRELQTLGLFVTMYISKDWWIYKKIKTNGQPLSSSSNPIKILTRSLNHFGLLLASMEYLASKETVVITKFLLKSVYSF